MKKTSLLLSLMMILTVISGCSSDEDIIFNYNVNEKIESLDPANAVKESEKTAIRAIFEGLCRIDAEGNVISGAAEKWQANANNTQFTFNIKKDAKWSDGTALTADDFVFGIKRAIIPQTGANDIEELFIIKNAEAVNKGQLDSQELGIRAIDEHILVIDLERSYEDLPRLTAGIRFMPCKEEFFNETNGRYGLEAAYMLTNGPFKFRNKYSWESGEYINLVSSSVYDGGNKTKSRDLIIKMNDTTINENPYEALINSKIDLLKVNAEEAADLREKGSEITIVGNGVYGLLINTRGEYLKDIRFRSLLMKTIERPDLISRLSNGAEAAVSIVPKTVQWEKKIYRNPNEPIYAQYQENVTQELDAILNELELKKFPAITILCRNDSYSQNIATGLIKKWNSTFSTSFNLEIAENDKDFDSRIANGNYEVALQTISSMSTTPEAFFRQFKSNARIGIMQSEVYDEAMNTILYDREAYKDLENLILNEYVFYPICYEYSYYATSPTSKGIIIVPDLGIDFIKAEKQIKK